MHSFFPDFLCYLLYCSSSPTLTVVSNQKRATFEILCKTTTSSISCRTLGHAQSYLKAPGCPKAPHLSLLHDIKFPFPLSTDPRSPLNDLIRRFFVSRELLSHQHCSIMMLRPKQNCSADTLLLICIILCSQFKNETFSEAFLTIYTPCS